MDQKQSSVGFGTNVLGGATHTQVVPHIVRQCHTHILRQRHTAATANCPKSPIFFCLIFIFYAPPSLPRHCYTCCNIGHLPNDPTKDTSYNYTTWFRLRMVCGSAPGICIALHCLDLLIRRIALHECLLAIKAALRDVEESDPGIGIASFKTFSFSQVSHQRCSLSADSNIQKR